MMNHSIGGLITDGRSNVSSERDQIAIWDWGQHVSLAWYWSCVTIVEWTACILWNSKSGIFSSFFSFCDPIVFSAVSIFLNYLANIFFNNAYFYLGNHYFMSRFTHLSTCQGDKPHGHRTKQSRAMFTLFFSICSFNLLHRHEFASNSTTESSKVQRFLHVQGDPKLLLTHSAV